MEKGLLQHGLILLPALFIRCPSFCPRRTRKQAPSPGKNREKEDGGLIGGQRNLGVKITVFWETAERLPAQQEPAWIPQETGMEETRLIQLKSLVAFPCVDKSNVQSYLRLQWPSVRNPAGKGRCFTLEAGKLRHGGFESLFGVPHPSQPQSPCAMGSEVLKYPQTGAGFSLGNHQICAQSSSGRLSTRRETAGGRRSGDKGPMGGHGGRVPSG